MRTYFAIAVVVLFGANILFEKVMKGGIHETLDKIDSSMNYRLDKRADPTLEQKTEANPTGN